MATNLFSEIEYLKGVGKAKGEKYRKLGISTPYDLLYHIPRDYMDFRTHIPIAQAENEEQCVLKLTITKKLPPKAIRKGLVICHAAATDGIDDILIVIYNNVYAFHALKEFGTYYMYGKVTGGFTRKEIHSPVYIPAESPVLIQPVYKLTQGLPINAVRQNMQQALSILEQSPFETLPQYIREKYELPDIVWALRNIHFPETNNAAEIARRRVAFEELLKLQLGMLMLKIRKKKSTSYILDKSTDMSDFYNTLPFQLTEGQAHAVDEITADMCSGSPMNRLLQGDVGSGKTAVAADDHKACNVQLTKLGSSLHTVFVLTKFIAAGGTQIGAGQVRDVQNGVQVQIHKIVFPLAFGVDQAVVTALDTDQRHIQQSCSTSNANDCGIHAGAVAATGKNCNIRHNVHSLTGSQEQVLFDQKLLCFGRFPAGNHNFIIVFIRRNGAVHLLEANQEAFRFQRGQNDLGMLFTASHMNHFPRGTLGHVRFLLLGKHIHEYYSMSDTNMLSLF